MQNRIVSHEFYPDIIQQPVLPDFVISDYSRITEENNEPEPILQKTTDLAEILVITSYPPRECGIATYSQDLIKALNNKFSHSIQ